MEVIQFVPQLGAALWNLKVMYDQHVENGNEIKELQSFIQDYDHQIPILQKRFQEGRGNVMGIAAFKNLEKDVMEATNKLESWSRNKSFFRVFNSVERMHKLENLHSKVMASVQKSLGIVNLSMLLDLQATQATILESNAELKSLVITSIGGMHGTLPAEVRDEVVEASTSSFGDPKFWEDILAAVDDHNAEVSSLKEKNEYEDPITTNLMIDPIVASDGNTYCRWTIIDNNWTSNPFNVDEDLTIVIDNLTFRRGLFEKFPEQAQIFRQRRNQYRSHALSLKAKGLLGDAVLALHYVLQWDKRDVECVEALEQVQGALQDAKEKYMQPSVGLSNEPSNGGPSGSSLHEMVVGTRIDLNEAYKLFPSLSSSILEIRQQAAYGICEWSERDAKFQRYIVKKGGVLLLAALLPSSDQITQECILSILLDISQSSHKYRTMFGTIKPIFRDALESIAKVLKEGSSKACEQAARILFNLSTSFDRRSIIGNYKAMHALVTSFGNGTLQVQQIVSSTLNNLFRPFPEVVHTAQAELDALLAGWVPILLRFIFLKIGPNSMLEEALPLVNEMLQCWKVGGYSKDIKNQAPATTWLEIMASDSPQNQERATSILYTLCYRDEEYSQHARECQALEQITQSTIPFRTRLVLLELLNSNVSDKNYPKRQIIPFPKMDWWSPERD